MAGKVGFVNDVLPGETVRIEITEDRPKRFHGRLLDVLTPSSHRVIPKCRHFGICGGCEWQHISYDQQLEIKKEILVEDLARLGKVVFDPGDVRVIPSQPWGYRGRIQVHIDKSGVTGFNARNSRRVVPILDCPVTRSAINEALFLRRVKPDDRGVGDGPDAGEAGSAGTEERAPGTEERAPGTEERARRLTLVESDNGVFGSLDDRAGVIDFNAPPPHIADDDPGQCCSEQSDENSHASCSIAGMEFVFDVRSFFQSNRSLLEDLAGVLGEYVSDRQPRTIIDLYAGAGLLASIGIKTAGTEYSEGVLKGVICVEADSRNARFIPGNLERAGVGGAAGGATVTVVPRQVERVVRNPRAYGIRSQVHLGSTMLIVDPPRSGISASVRRWICRERFGSIVYLSCDSAALARDMASLSGAYYARTILLFDFYPQTAHIESLVMMEPKEQ